MASYILLLPNYACIVNLPPCLSFLDEIQYNNTIKTLFKIFNDNYISQNVKKKNLFQNNFWIIHQSYGSKVFSKPFLWDLWDEPTLKLTAYIKTHIITIFM